MSQVIYVEALQDARTVPITRPTFKVFLAGGITGCPDWQKEVVNNLTIMAKWEGDHLPDILLMNPRRANFPMDDPTAAKSQIEWEYNHLRQADAISFWFAPETIQPIVLFEYGYWLGQDKPLIIGVDPKYPRRDDVLIQTDLAQPQIVIRKDLEGLCLGIVAAAKDWLLNR